MGPAGIEVGWAALGIALALIALALLIRAGQWRRASGLPAGDILYTDTGTWYAQQAPLSSTRLRLTGRPDYLIEEPDGMIVPVEIKSGTAPPYPYEGHILQLAAYCLLVEETYGLRPERGVLHYADQAYAIPFTAELEDNVLDLLTDMHADRRGDEVDRDHGDWQRCAGCGHRDHCYQSLA
jgi:CRISPR-associated exonuclease Cas4